MEVAITSMTHNGSSQAISLNKNVKLVESFDNDTYLRISSLAARTTSGRLEIGTQTSVARSLLPD